MTKTTTFPEYLTAFGEGESPSQIRLVSWDVKPVYTSGRMHDLDLAAAALEAMRVFGGTDMAEAPAVWSGLLQQTGDLYLADTEGYPCFGPDGAEYTARSIDVVEAFGDKRLVICVCDESRDAFAYYER